MLWRQPTSGLWPIIRMKEVKASFFKIKIMTYTNTALPEKKQSFIRIDKNIAMSGADLLRTYKNHATMVLDVLLYNARVQQRNLWDMEYLDVHDFAKKQGYKANHLLEQVENPFQAEDEKNLDNLKTHEKFTNVIGNTLWLMNTKPLKFKKSRKDYTDNEFVTEIESYLLLEKLGKHTSMKRKDQFYYSYTVDETFKRHINRFFTQIDPEMIASLRKSNTAFLYLNLITLRDNVLRTGEEATPVFDELVELCGINIARPSDQKFKLQQKFDIINNKTDLKFTSRFVRNNGRFKYGLVLEFEANQKLPAKSEVLSEAVLNHVDLMLIDFYKKQYCSKRNFSMNDFKEWYFDADRDFDIKISTYSKAHHLIRKTATLEISERHTMKDARKHFRSA